MLFYHRERSSLIGCGVWIPRLLQTMPTRAKQYHEWISSPQVFLTVSQQWSREWFGAVGLQGLISANFDPVLGHHIASLVHNGLINMIRVQRRLRLCCEQDNGAFYLFRLFILDVRHKWDTLLKIDFYNFPVRQCDAICRHRSWWTLALGVNCHLVGAKP